MQWLPNTQLNQICDTGLWFFSPLKEMVLHYAPSRVFFEEVFNNLFTWLGVLPDPPSLFSE